MAMNPHNLVCPVCRKPSDGHPVDPDTLICENPDCGHQFTRLRDGIAVLTADEDAVMACNVLDDLGPIDLLDQVEQEQVGSKRWQWLVWAGMYAHSHYSGIPQPFSTLADTLLPRLETPVLQAADLGTGAGRMALEVAVRTGADVVAMDANPLVLRWAQRVSLGGPVRIPVLETARRFELTTIQAPQVPPEDKIQWICGDLFKPPLRAEAFDLVSMVSVLDTVPEPRFALGQACELLRPGGYLILAQPETWDAATTPPDKWLADGRIGWETVLGEFGMKPEFWIGECPWTVQRTPRQLFQYSLRGCLARKSG